MKEEKVWSLRKEKKVEENKKDGGRRDMELKKGRKEG